MGEKPEERIFPGAHLSLSEIYAVRFADDIRAFCQDRNTAEKILYTSRRFLQKRLKLELNPQKTRIINTKQKYMDFLGFKIKVHQKGFIEKKDKEGKISREPKYVVTSHIEDKALKNIINVLIEQIKRIQSPKFPRTERDEVVLYNYKVSGIQNYYQLATEINKDLGKVYSRLLPVFKNRLRVGGKSSRLAKAGRNLSIEEKKRYGQSKMLRYAKACREPIYPLAYIRTRHPIHKKRTINRFTPQGREKLYNNLKLNTSILWKMAKQPSKGNSIEYMDNRLSLFSAQNGKCAVSGLEFQETSEIHCHHIVPKHLGGGDNYQNLVLVMDGIHRLIHAKNQQTIHCLMEQYHLNQIQLAKLNRLRIQAGLKEIKSL